MQGHDPQAHDHHHRTGWLGWERLGVLEDNMAWSFSVPLIAPGATSTAEGEAARVG
ncbi:hypothetical protein [Phytoactinopolyspora mesophila]|uniref:Uncharacterized protein n=1 Tax=Phytoactinopolyspora mesophila TaxID=2650750 RepID=A0A7K3M0K8_9ACTN|nr:hypothetical protein [Phytoactinopolyspora mesophila]NDL56809.1 hypothetical protein [Phytoactinopolyspora mesophila]